MNVKEAVRSAVTHVVEHERRGEAQRAGGDVTNAHTNFSSWCVARRDGCVAVSLSC